MADVLTKEQRSYNMSQIRNRNTKPELLLRKNLWAKGYRGYRINSKIVGKPDIVFNKYKIAIFIDGCFWHKCPKCYKNPKSNKKFWKNKIDGNVKRDIIVNKELKKMGWKVIRIWEHQIENNAQKITDRICKVLNINEIILCK
jgi:DNA mismatch endonuclease, patch repair protein